MIHHASILTGIIQKNQKTCGKRIANYVRYLLDKVTVFGSVC